MKLSLDNIYLLADFNFHNIETFNIKIFRFPFTILNFTIDKKDTILQHRPYFKSLRQLYHFDMNNLNRKAIKIISVCTIIILLNTNVILYITNKILKK